MGRELKRVPLDFDWPLGKAWIGYINPHYAKCLAQRPRNNIGALSLLMLSGDDARRGKCHPYFVEAPLYRTKGMTCGTDMTELTDALASRESSIFGYDAIDKWSATKKILDVACLGETWGICPDCNGEGIPANSYAAYEAWVPTEPPAGEGYQIWETVSEGSPISPVFATPEELAAHMSTTRWGCDEGSSTETWLRFINGPGSAMSIVMDEHGVRSGVEFSCGKI